MEDARPLAELVSALPERYHPIFGHPEFADGISRPGTDRLAPILAVHDALRHLLGRPLRVLDLGCGQGFFSLSLAERGASVRGIDRVDENVAVCRALAHEHPGFDVSFERASVEDVLASLDDDACDLVLGLSVFHHLVHERGVAAVRPLVDLALARTAVVVIESALHEEPMYWAASQPSDPEALLAGAAFVHEAGRYETHLSSTPRPLYVASARVWVLDGHAVAFDRWLISPHRMAEDPYSGSRRYFLSATTILKYFSLTTELAAVNADDIAREAALLAAPPPGLVTPRPIISGSNERRTWLARELLPGTLLTDVLLDGGAVDAALVFRDVLVEAAALERAGLYHSDVRTWNVLLRPDGHATLIDYGSIGPEPIDRVWPRNIFVAFLIFARELATGIVGPPYPVRNASVNPFDLPVPFTAWAQALWQHPMGAWTFELMLALWDAGPAASAAEPVPAAIPITARALEAALEAHAQFSEAAWRRLDAADAEQRKALAALAALLDDLADLRRISNAQALDLVDLRGTSNAQALDLVDLRAISNAHGERIESVAATLVGAHRRLRADHNALAESFAATQRDHGERLEALVGELQRLREDVRAIARRLDHVAGAPPATGGEPPQP